MTVAKRLRGLVKGDDIAWWELVVVVVVIAIAATFRWVQTDEGWFWLDDWEFLTRDPGSLDDWLRPHAGHWNTVPMAAYRGLFTIFGMEFSGYQAFRVIGHAAFAFAFWRIMRWRGGDPVISVIATAVGLVLSSTVEYKVIAVGVWVAFPALLIAATLIERNENPTRRTRALVGGLLVSAMMSTGIGALGAAAMFALLVVARRGDWVRATAIPLAIYGIWYLRYRDGVGASGDAGLTDSTTLGSLPKNLVELAQHALDQVTFPDTGIGPALLVALGVALVRLARRGEIGFAASAMLSTIALYFVGVHVIRIEGGIQSVSAARYANTPYYLLVPVFVGLIPRTRQLFSTLTLIGLGLALVVGQANKLATMADGLAGTQNENRAGLIVARQLMFDGEPVHFTTGHSSGIPAPEIIDAKGWPTIDEVEPAAVEAARGNLRVGRAIDLAPLSVLPNELIEHDFAPLLADGAPLTECTEPAGPTLSYRGEVAFRVLVEVADFGDPAAVTVVTNDSYGRGRKTIKNANFSIITAIAPEGEPATLTLESEQNLVEICPWPPPEVPSRDG